MREIIVEKMERLKEKYEIMNGHLKKLEEEQQNAIAELMRLDGAFRELSSILEEYDKKKEEINKDEAN